MKELVIERLKLNKKEYEKYFRGNGLDISFIPFCIEDISKFKINKLDNVDLKENKYLTRYKDMSYDFVLSVFNLQNQENIDLSILNWIRVVKNGGYVIITIPDEDMNKGEESNYTFNYYRDRGINESVYVRDYFENIEGVKLVSLKRISTNYSGPTETSEEDRSEKSIEVILYKESHNYKPILNWALNGFCFMLNSLALGDVIASIPSIKYMIDRYYTDGSYKVVAKEMFRPLFWFVPDTNFTNFEDKENDWNIPKSWSIGVLNQKIDKTGISRNTPRFIHLSQFGGFKLTDRLFDLNSLNYLPLIEGNISKFNLPKKYVVIVSTYRDETRMWDCNYILEIAEWLITKKITPIFIGKTDMNEEMNLSPKSSLPFNLNIGIDLRNKTSLIELYTIMKNAKAVIGLDSGPIHLAGCTSTPIICGYTTVDSKYRIPIRKKGKTYIIKPNIDCCYCESNWASSFWNYEKCYFNTNDCCKEMTSNKFITHLKEILKVQ